MPTRRPPRDPATTKPLSASKPASAAARPTGPTLEAALSVPHPLPVSLAPTSAAPKAKAGRARPVNKVQSATRGPQGPSVSPDVRRAMIAEGAYLRAERRGFSGGNEDADWLAAEREVDELLGARVTNPAQ